MVLNASLYIKLVGDEGKGKSSVHAGGRVSSQIKGESLYEENAFGCILFPAWSVAT